MEQESTKNKPKIIMGIDPGLATVGYGFITCEREPQLISCGCIETKAGIDFNKRLNEIHKELTFLIKKYKPSFVGVEKLYFCKNVKTAMDVGHARGVIILTLSEAKLPIYEYTPLEIKLAIASYGKADKNQIKEMVKIILKLKTVPKKDDTADALAIALTCKYRMR